MYLLIPSTASHTLGPAQHPLTSYTLSYAIPSWKFSVFTVDPPASAFLVLSL